MKGVYGNLFFAEGVGRKLGYSITKPSQLLKGKANSEGQLSVC